MSRSNLSVEHVQNKTNSVQIRYSDMNGTSADDLSLCFSDFIKFVICYQCRLALTANYIYAV